jgi:hypothetical protein
MDAFEHIAFTYKADCIKKLEILEQVNIVLEFSECVDMALRLIFIQSGSNPEDYKQILLTPNRMAKLISCIEATEVSPELFVCLFLI